MGLLSFGTGLRRAIASRSGWEHRDSSGALAFESTASGEDRGQRGELEAGGDREHGQIAGRMRLPAIRDHGGEGQITPSRFISATAWAVRPSQSLSTWSVCSPSIGDDVTRVAFPSTRTGQLGILNGRCTG